jgi:zinc protease
MMKRTALTLALLTSFALTPTLPSLAAPAESATFVRASEGIQEYKLSNGLKVLLVENHAAPVISTMLIYRVGSRNEAVGYTGSTHFLEHMLFKGTPTFNKEKNTQIAKSLLSEGASFNATTWLDRTTYFETLPSNQLDLALRIESDRMRNSFIADAERKNEMTVVRNELERGENNPDRVMSQQLFANAFMAHPYHHPTIGWRSDVEGVPTERLKQFYKDFYYPNNATLILVGDFKTAEALEGIVKNFSPIKASPGEIPSVYTQEPPQQGERRFSVRRPGQLGIVTMGFHIPPMEHTDSVSLDVLQAILSQGVTSRLEQALVEKGLAVSASAWAAELRDPGLFVVTAKLASGVTHEKVEAVMVEVIEGLKKTPPTPAELDKVKNQILADFTFSNHGTYELASSLAEYEASADWRYLLTYPARIKAVSAADVQRVVQTYLQPQNRTTGWFIPEKAGEIEVNVRNLNYDNLPKAATASSASGMAPIQRMSLARNGKLIVQENHLDQTVAIRANLMAGSINDPVGKAGLAALTASMLERGTKKQNKINLSQKLESMGSSITFAAELERAQVYGRTLSQNLDATMALLFEMLKEPAFDKAEFDKLKKQSLDHLRQALDNTDILAGEELNRALYPAGHPLALSSEQELKQLEGITLDDVKSFYAQHWGSNEMILTVVGDVQAAKVATTAQAAIKDWKSDNSAAVVIPDVPSQAAGKTVIKTLKDKDNISIAMGVQSAIKLGGKDYFAALIANHALGQSSLSSRLGLRVRDELGLTYGIYSYFPGMGRGAGPWFVGVTTNPKNVAQTISATKEVIAKYVKEGITDEEFKLAKSSMIGSYLVRLSTNPQIAERLTDAIFYNLGENYLTERAGQIQAVSKEDVNRLIRTYFDPARLTTAVVGNYDGK